MNKCVPEKAVRRQAALVPELVGQVLRAVASGAPADAELKRIFRQHGEYGSRDRALFSESVFSFFRWRGWVANALPGPEDLAAACVLAHVLDARDIHPAIARLAGDTALRNTPLDPMGALGLDAKAEGLSRLAGGRRFAPRQLVPDWVASALVVPRDSDSDDFILRTIESFQTRPPTWLRIRPGVFTGATALLDQAGIEWNAHARLSSAVAIRPGANLRDLAPRLGDFAEVQDLASQAVGLVCAPTPGSRWWDACCGSGGKALHLADLMGTGGRVFATDVRPTILDRFDRRRAAGDAGRGRIETRAWDAMRDPLPADSFDGVLVDAPCSGLGTWSRNPDARWRTPETRVGELAALQETLLRKCAASVKAGGTLVYATCTLTRAENETVTERFSESNAGFRPDEFVHPLTGSPCHGSCWIRPWDGPCNGMYVARWVRSL